MNGEPRSEEKERKTGKKKMKADEVSSV